MSDPLIDPSQPSAADPTSQPSPVPATSGTPAAPSATPTGPLVSATTDDRSTWVPPYRLRETREAAIREANQQFAQREAEIRREAEQYRSQLHAIVGATAPANPEIQNVKQQFGSLYPGLAKLEAQADELLALRERAGDLESQNNHYWRSYANQTMDRLYNHAADSLGSPLTDEGKRSLHAAFTGWIQTSPELSERYANDPTLVEDFWKAFTSSFIDPARRTSAATVATRAGAIQSLPQDTRTGLPSPPAPPKPANLDERAAAAWASYNTPKS